MSIDPTAIELHSDPTTERIYGYTAHDNLRIDVPYISHIDGNLYQGGCATGLVLPRYIEHVVSLYPWEQYTVRHDLRSSLTVRMHDSVAQDMSGVDDIARWVNHCLESGPTLVHCQAGLNRSGLVVARSMTLRGVRGVDAVALIRERRSSACLCNPAFYDWIVDADSSSI